MNEELRNTHFTELKVKDGICDALRERTGSRPDVDSANADANSSANADAKAFLDPAISALPGLYPDRDTKRRLAALEVLPEKNIPSLEQVWGNFTAPL